MVLGITLQAVFSFLGGFRFLFGAVIYAAGGIALRRWNSRTAAVVLLVLAGVSAGVTLANKAGADLGGGNNIFLATLVLWVGVRVVEATFKLHGQFAEPASAVMRLSKVQPSGNLIFPVFTSASQIFARNSISLITACASSQFSPNSSAF